MINYLNIKVKLFYKNSNLIGDKMSNITEIYYSPSNTTKTVVNQISSNFESEKTSLNLIASPKIEKTFNDEDLIIVGMPVFAGRIPKIAREKLELLKGNDTPAIAVVNYGNRDYDYALYELKEVLTKNGFKVFAAAAFISHHSLFPGVAIGRPDSEDIKLINEFSAKCIEKLENKQLENVEVPGEDAYRDYKNMPIVPFTNECKCTFCLECITTCPLGAISEDDPLTIDANLCDACTACIYICPEDARSFVGETYETMNSKFVTNNSERKEGELFL